MQAQPTVVEYPLPDQPVVAPRQPQRRVNLRSFRWIAITQLSVGILMILLGIVVFAIFNKWYWLTKSGVGIWSGVWIVVTGILGVLSSRNLDSTGFNGTYMAFSIISTVVAFIAGIFVIVGVSDYNSCSEWRYHMYFCRGDDISAAKGLYIVMLLLLVLEFFISIVAAALCCQNSSCCTQQTPGIIVAQPAQYQFMQNSQGQTVVTSNVYASTGNTTIQYPAGQQPQIVYAQAAAYPQQLNIASYPGQVLTQAAGGQFVVSQPQQAQGQIQTTVYPAQAPGYNPLPPPYTDTPSQEK